MEYKLTLKFNKKARPCVMAVQAKDEVELRKKIEQDDFLRKHKERWEIDPPINQRRFTNGY